ncbi:MAG: hypothetical protein ACK40C_13250 [Novosphingobium meiothermophilum]
MIFRPAPPSWNEIWLVLAMAALVLLLLLGVVIGQSDRAITPLALSGLLLAGAFYLPARNRFPGRPMLYIDTDGLRYDRGGKQQVLAWADVSEILKDFTLRTMTFISRSGRGSIKVHADMVCADGRRLDTVFDSYWKPRTSRR